MGTSKNYGDQVRDAIQEAIDKQNYGDLANVVGRSIGDATEAIGSSLRQASQAAQVAQVKQQAARDRFVAQQEQQRIQAQNKAAIRGRFDKVTKQKAIGWVASIAGGVCAGAYGLCLLVCLPSFIATFDAISLGGILLLGSLTLGGAALMRFGTGRLGLVNRFQSYQSALGLRQHCAVDELASQLALKPGKVVDDLRKMIGMGLFKQGHLNDEGTHFMVTDYAYSQYREKTDNARLAAHRRQIRERAMEHRLAGSSLDLEARAILKKGEDFVAQIRRSNEAILGEEISATIDQIESVVRSIFEYAVEHPEVIPELDRLMDYYLPTTVKLLDAYEDLDRQPVQGANIRKSKAEIEATLDTLNTAFGKLLDSIFSDVAWDVSTDVSVLHAVLAQEGLAENPFEGKNGSGRSDAASGAAGAGPTLVL